MLPFFGNCLVEEGVDRRAELVEGFVVSIMGRVLMHKGEHLKGFGRNAKQTHRHGTLRFAEGSGSQSRRRGWT